MYGVTAAPGSPAMVLGVRTGDVHTACARPAGGGVPVPQPPRDTGNNNRNALRQDPDGNPVEIVAEAS